MVEKDFPQREHIIEKLCLKKNLKYIHIIIVTRLPRCSVRTISYPSTEHGVNGPRSIVIVSYPRWRRHRRESYEWNAGAA